jgi:hypothetical protein
VEEPLHLLSHLSRCVHWSRVILGPWSIGTPLVNEPLEHAVGTKLVDLAQAAESYWFISMTAVENEI